MRLIAAVHCEVVAKFLFQLALETIAMQEPDKSAPQFLHTASITRAMAVMTRSKARSSRASCFFPSGVSW